MFRKMSLTVTQSKYNSTNKAIQPPQPMTTTSTRMLPFSKRNFSSMTLSMSPAAAVIPAMMNRPPAQGYQRHVPNLPTSSVQPDGTQVPKMLWGKPTWYLLHMMATKVKDNLFPEIRTQLLATIFSICSNLPCPTCAEHAKDYLTKINFLNVQTKEELKTVLFNFHNEVNQRKGYPTMTRMEHDNLYLRSDPVVIIQNFILAFNRKNKNIRLLSDDLTRQRMTDSLKEWFKRYIGYFDPPVIPSP